MSYPSTIREKVLSLAAGASEPVEIGVADFLLFASMPAGLLVAINDQPFVQIEQGLLHYCPPGEGNYRTLRVKNVTGGALTGRVLYGLGSVAFTGGQVTITGSLPLPAGAATAAKQDSGIGVLTSLISIAATANLQATGNTTLAALLAAVATATKQDAQTALLTTLAAATTETPDVVSITGPQAFANCREISIENTGAANITATPAGGSARTITPGLIRTWRVSGPFNELATITVDATGSSADVLTTV